MSNKIFFPDIIELYITNECNLTCSDCNRYNNYNFSGHYEWRPYEQAMLAWGRRITAPTITIIGGEPCLHPDLYGWVDLAARAWPESKIMIQSNGTIKLPNLDAILQIAPGRTGIVASIHQESMRNSIKNKNNFTDGQLIDNTTFNACSLIDHGSYFTVYDSDPYSAWEACSMSVSHTILNGRLYKCPMTAVLPEFRKQYQVNLTAEQELLLYSYRSLAHDCSQEELDAFLERRNQEIPQCRLCPGEFITKKVTFDTSRKKRKKINSGDINL